MERITIYTLHEEANTQTDKQTISIQKFTQYSNNASKKHSGY